MSARDVDATTRHEWHQEIGVLSGGFFSIQQGVQSRKVKKIVPLLCHIIAVLNTFGGNKTHLSSFY